MLRNDGLFLGSSAAMNCVGAVTLVHGSYAQCSPTLLMQAQYLLRNDGLFLGSSAAMNCVGAVKLARKLGPGHTIVTILCDGGQR